MRPPSPVSRLASVIRMLSPAGGAYTEAKSPPHMAVKRSGSSPATPLTPHACNSFPSSSFHVTNVRLLALKATTTDPASGVSPMTTWVTGRRPAPSTRSGCRRRTSFPRSWFSFIHVATPHVIRSPSAVPTARLSPSKARLAAAVGRPASGPSSAASSGESMRVKVRKSQRYTRPLSAVSVAANSSFAITMCPYRAPEVAGVVSSAGTNPWAAFSASLGPAHARSVAA
mmetsp:Transcript_13782/g.45334  ORF Transcript_13782/g.45334 Transcript_13782/m.45334 type:complete len:228 (-) Transcript_13782:135-818(-)